MISNFKLFQQFNISQNFVQNVQTKQDKGVFSSYFSRLVFDNIR